MKVLREAQAESGLSEDDAMKLANDELHAMRSEHDDAQRSTSGARRPDRRAAQSPPRADH